LLTFPVDLLQPRQESYYDEVWEQDRAELFEEFFDIHYNQQNLSEPVARVLAFEKSANLATGNKGCVVNTYSGGKGATMRNISLSMK